MFDSCDIYDSTTHQMNLISCESKFVWHLNESHLRKRFDFSFYLLPTKTKDSKTVAEGIFATTPQNDTR